MSKYDMPQKISARNGRTFTVELHLGKYLAGEFRNGQYGLNIESKFFSSAHSAVSYGLRMCAKD